MTLSLTIRAGSGSDGFCLPVDVRRVLAPGGGSEPPVSPKLTYRLKNAGRDTPCSVSGTRYDEVNLVFVVPASEREFLFEAGLEDPREFRVTDKSSRLELAVLPNPPATDSLPAVPAAKSKRFSRRFQGRVGATPVFDFVLESDGTKLRGHYRYTRTGQLHWLEGELGLDGEYSLREFFPKGKLTGRLKGKSLMAATLRGYFTRPDGETPQSFEFEEIGAGPGAGAPLVPFDDPATVPTEGDPTAAE